MSSVLHLMPSFTLSNKVCQPKTRDENSLDLCLVLFFPSHTQFQWVCPFWTYIYTYPILVHIRIYFEFVKYPFWKGIKIHSISICINITPKKMVVRIPGMNMNISSTKYKTTYPKVVYCIYVNLGKEPWVSLKYG
jgi:hypothetical protein